jgi:Bacterial PH domain
MAGRGPFPPELPVTWRPRRGRRVAYAIAVLVVLTMGGLALALPGQGAGAFGQVDRALLFALGLAVATGLCILARPRVDADASGVTVVNLFHSRRLEWAEIVEVRLASGDPWVMLDLSDGGTLAAMGIQAADGERGRRQAAELAVLVDRHTRTERDD